MVQHKFNDNDFQEHYRVRYAAQGQTYGQYRPAYEFGFQMAGERKHRDRAWDEGLEREAQRGWEQHSLHMPWIEARDAVREGYLRRRGQGGPPRPLGYTSMQRGERDTD